MIGFYVTAAIIVLMIVYAGFENTFRLFAYIDLQLRYAFIRVRMEFMKRKLKKQLDRDVEKFMSDRND